MPLRISCAVILVLGVPAVSAAQRSGAPVRVHGVAYDSLRGAPLASARITLAGRSTMTDARGRFQFDSVAPGSYTIAAQHASLDSAGFSGLSSRAVIAEGQSEVRIATPSFETLWTLVCRRAPPKDSGLVYGTVRETREHAPASDVLVRLAWTELIRNGKRSVRQKLWMAETRSDFAGTYVICGVPTGASTTVQASAPVGASGIIDVPPSTSRVHRRDLTLGPPAEDSAHHAVVAGLVTGPDGEAVPDAFVTVNGVGEVRTGEDGSFTLYHVPGGTRQFEAYAIGMKPVTRVVDVAPRDTQRLALTMSRITSLGAVRVAAKRGRILAQEFEDRRKSALGYVVDSTVLSESPRLLNALAVVPSLNIFLDGASVSLGVPATTGGLCAPDLRIDGVLAGYTHLQDLVPRDIAAVEVYAHALSVPPRYMTDRSKRPCGVVLVWTKYAFRVR